MPEKSYDGGLFGGTDDCVLGIDPSLTGFAVTALGMNDQGHQTWVYTSPKRGVSRLLDIGNWLDDRVMHISRSRNIRDAAIEAGVVRSQSAFVLGELHGEIKTRLYQLPISRGRFPLQVPPMSLKKYIAGKANGVQKNQILLKVYQKWGVEFTDDNAADSYGLAQLCRTMYCMQNSLSYQALSYETDVLLKLADDKFRDTDDVVTA